MKKEIIFVINDMGGGGAEKVLVNILKNLDRDKFIIKLFLIEKSGVYLKEVPEDVDMVYCFEKLSSGFFKKHISKFFIERKLIEFARKSDILISFLEYYPTYLVANVSKKLNKKSIAWIHTNFNKYLTVKHRILGNYYYKFIDKIFVVSDECRDIAVREISSLQGKTFTMYNPIDISEIRIKAGQSIDININGIRLIGIGRLNEGKAFDDLIKAQNILRNKGYNTKVIILGEGSYRVQLESLVKELKLEDTVYMPGFVQNPYNWLVNSDIFVLSSKYEGLPTVLIEALALNKQVVATNCSGVSEILEEERYGKIAPIGDYKAIASSVEDIINKKYIPQPGSDRANDFDLCAIIEKIEFEILNL